jgi:ferric-dicitrate binding protein FerR (iron transport regulator)
VSDAQLQALRFTGVLPAQDSDAALALLQAALPIRIESYSQLLIQVRKR